MLIEITKCIRKQFFDLKRISRWKFKNVDLFKEVVTVGIEMNPQNNSVYLFLENCNAVFEL